MTGRDESERHLRATRRSDARRLVREAGSVFFLVENETEEPFWLKMYKKQAYEMLKRHDRWCLRSDEQQVTCGSLVQMTRRVLISPQALGDHTPAPVCSARVLPPKVVEIEPVQGTEA